ncbi:hypothetical protein CEXT_618951 [Caerostris extrusa]|uniref:Uncharacterized protein n=1 Tax=Caerostris extrusa TaxID=172846 RepID=A0AAV4T504_CAEEX|nr:hypothetical protein CEXT_618951 [Caerostris extrusa]
MYAPYNAISYYVERIPRFERESTIQLCPKSRNDLLIKNSRPYKQKPYPKGSYVFAEHVHNKYKQQSSYVGNEEDRRREPFPHMPGLEIFFPNNVTFVLCFVFLTIGIVSCVFLCRILREESEGNQITGGNPISPDPETTHG